MNRLGVTHTVWVVYLFRRLWCLSLFFMRLFSFRTFKEDLLQRVLCHWCFVVFANSRNRLLCVCVIVIMLYLWTEATLDCVYICVGYIIVCVWLLLATCWSKFRYILKLTSLSLACARIHGDWLDRRDKMTFGWWFTFFYTVDANDLHRLNWMFVMRIVWFLLMGSWCMFNDNIRLCVCVWMTLGCMDVKRYFLERFWI